MNILLEFKIPLKDEDLETKLEMRHDLQAMARSFSPTTFNALFSIEYELEIFIKHKSKTEQGKGRVVRFPIIIDSPS